MTTLTATTTAGRIWTGLEEDFDRVALLAAMREALPVTVDEAWVEAEALAMVRGTGYIGIAADRLLHRGWPLEAVAWSLGTFPASTPARDRARRLATALAAGDGGFERETGRTGLGLVGAPGRGKTGLACAIGAALDAAGRDVRFVRWGDVMASAYAALRAPRDSRPANAGPSFGSARPQSLDAITADLAGAEVLILDDLGEEHAAGMQPDFARRVLRAIVWPRYERRAALIVTTNLSPEEMDAQFGEAATSRLAGMLHWLVLDGEDERRAR